MDANEGLSRFDVALWRYWPPSCDEFAVIGLVSAPDAAAAVVAVMWAFGWKRAGHVAARKIGSRVMYRADGVWLPREEPVFVYTNEGKSYKYKK